MKELTSPLATSRPKPKPTCLLITIAVLSSFCNGVFLNIRGPCVKDIAERANITPAQMGWFFIASGVGGIIAALPAGKVIDYFGNPMTTLCGGLVVRAATCFGLPYVTSVVPLMLIGIAQGFTLPVVGVSLRASILWTFKGKTATPYLNLVMAAFGFGSMVAPLLYDWFAVISSSSAPLDWTFWGLACFCLLMAGASLCVDRTRFEKIKRKRKKRIERSEQRRQQHQRSNMYDQVMNRDQGDDDDGDGEEEDENSISLPNAPTTRQSLIFFLLVNLYMGVSVGIECTVGNWLYTLAGGNKITGFSTATWVNTTLWGTFTLTRLVLVYVLKNGIHEKTILQLSHFCMLAGLSTACGLFHLSSEGGAEGVIYPPWALWFLAISFGIGIAPSFPNVMGLAGRLYPWPFTGTIQSTFGISANAGNGIFPGAAGLLTNIPSIGGLSFIYVPICGVICMQILLMMLYCWRPNISGNGR
jgi:MFS family permease